MQEANTPVAERAPEYVGLEVKWSPEQPRSGIFDGNDRPSETTARPRSLPSIKMESNDR